MRDKNNRLLKIIGLVIIFAVTLVVPRFLSSGYYINALITTVRWIIFALSFDLVAGHVGAVSLGHPVFFGVGAYVTAILGARLNLGFVPNLLLSALLMGLLALIVGFAFFRIRGVTFAIGTLGALIISQMIANNAFDLTGGPMCAKGIARPEFVLPFTDTVIRILKPIDYYYLQLPLLAITIIIYLAIVNSRVGRSFAAVRGDEVRASAIGINPLRYKLFAFSVGAALAGALGSFQAQYITVICPSELSISVTTTLLVIVFVGGVASFKGVMLGALIFSILPRLLEMGGTSAIAPAYQQIAYGLILVLIMLFMPEGLAGLFDRKKKRPQSQNPQEEISDIDGIT